MLLADRTCSHCLRTFKPRLFGVNLAFKRYEVCPFCHHFTEVHFLPPVDPAKAADGGQAEGKPPSEEEALQRQIDESKYEVK